jgi:hypothetical protein
MFSAVLRFLPTLQTALQCDSYVLADTVVGCCCRNTYMMMMGDNGPALPEKLRAKDSEAARLVRLQLCTELQHCNACDIMRV